MKLRGRTTRSVAHGRRSLIFELLERRDLLAVIRLVDWNTANAPNMAADPDYTAILQAIGEETVQGNTKRLDILALQETDFIPAGNESIQKITDILNTLYPAADYVSQYSAEDGGGDSTGFVYDTTTVSLVGTPIDVPGALTHTIRRAQFRPGGTLGESDFYVYSVHLKSGDSGPDVTLRGNEAAVLRADADALGEGAHVLMVGDFNMKTSTEAAWANLTAAGGAGQLQDVVNMPGNWFNNPAFKNLHSQDPGAVMDDRFDIHFASGEFFNGTGLEYITGSFHVFGNNGTHTFGQPITTGTGASSAVLAALANASDHLPVIADYEVIPSTPNVRITETGGGTKVIEGGLYDTYYAVLDTMPSANVTVTVTPNAQLDVGNGAGVARQLTFTPANWQTPQVVEVRAANDVLNEGNHNGSIAHTSASTDVNYNGLTIAGVTATIVDNESPTIVINELDADQVDTDTQEFIELYDGGIGNTSLSGYIVVFFNGNDNNDGSYLTIDLTGQSTDANGFFVLGNTLVPGVDLLFNNNFLQNGPDAVALYFASAAMFPNDTDPTATNLRDAVVYSNSATDDAALRAILTPGQPLVLEDQNGAATTESMSRRPDGGTALVTTSYVAQAPTPDARNMPPAPSVLIVHSGTRVDVTESGVTDSYQLALGTIPTANVQITVDPDGQTNLGAGAGVPVVLTFTPANALLPQTVTVVAVDDAVPEGIHTSVITHTAASADTTYNGVTIGSVVANITDNDFSAPPVIVISEIMYNPASDETVPGVGEWLEIVNAGTAAVDLGGWFFDDDDPGSWGSIPPGTVLNPGQVAVFFDTSFTTAATFRTEWNVPLSSLVVGITWEGLANTPDATDAIRLIDNSAAIQDQVAYDNNENGWPNDNGLSSIYLKGLSLDNNSGANWALSTVGVAGVVSPTGATFNTGDRGSPGRFFLPGDYNVNGVVDAADSVVWRNTLNDNVPNGTGADGDGNGIIQQADYDFWRANFGNVGAYYSGGAGAGAGDVVTESVASQSVVASVSVPVRAVADVSDEGSSAVDLAVADVALNPLPFVPAVAAKTVVPMSSPARGVAAVDLLLVVDRPPATIHRADDVDAVFDESPAEDWADVDAFYALLGELEVAAVGVWQS